MCLFASPYSKSLTTLFSPSFLRQMEIIGSSACSSLSTVSDLSYLNQSHSLSCLFTHPLLCLPLCLCPSPSTQIHIERFQTAAELYNFNQCFITLVRSSYRSHDTHFPRQGGIDEKPLDSAGPGGNGTASITAFLHSMVEKDGHQRLFRHVSGAPFPNIIAL